MILLCRLNQSVPASMQKSSYILGPQIHLYALPPYANGGRLMITKAFSRQHLVIINAVQVYEPNNW